MRIFPKGLLPKRANIYLRDCIVGLLGRRDTTKFISAAPSPLTREISSHPLASTRSWPGWLSALAPNLASTLTCTADLPVSVGLVRFDHNLFIGRSQLTIGLTGTSFEILMYPIIGPSCRRGDPRDFRNEFTVAPLSPG